MKKSIGERVYDIECKLMHILRRESYDRDNAVQKLKEFGIADMQIIDVLLSAFDSLENANKAKRGTYASCARSSSGISYGNDIERAEQDVIRHEARFNSIISKSAYIKLAQEIDMNEVDEVFLNQLSENGIIEGDIKNSALKLTYGYYMENKKNKEALADMRQQVELLQGRNNHLYQENQNLRGQLDKLSVAYKALQETFKSRIDECEDKYQSALNVIRSLRDRLSDLQHRGFFQFIKSKLMHQEVLPEGDNEKLATTLKTTGEKLAPDILPGQSLENILETSKITPGYCKDSDEYVLVEHVEVRD